MHARVHRYTPTRTHTEKSDAYTILQYSHTILVSVEPSSSTEATSGVNSPFALRELAGRRGRVVVIFVGLVSKQLAFYVLLVVIRMLIPRPSGGSAMPTRRGRAESLPAIRSLTLGEPLGRWELPLVTTSAIDNVTRRRYDAYTSLHVLVGYS
jgi:hypothetical protein